MTGQHRSIRPRRDRSGLYLGLFTATVMVAALVLLGINLAVTA